MLVGQQALDGYLKEVGRVSGAHSSLDLPTAIGPDLLGGLAQEAAGLLGDRYDALRAVDRLGQASPTPPPKRHRVIELISFAQTAADLLERHGPTAHLALDGNQLSEIVTMVSLFRRWRNHPAWSRLVESLAADTEGPHTLMVLTVASYLVDAGNGVGIVFANAPGRIPDIWLQPTLTERLNVEVKTPQVLRGPRKTSLTSAAAEDLIQRQLKRAASTKGGQLDPAQSGILAIGGFHLGEDTMETLAAAAARVLQSQASRKRHLAALMFSEVSYLLDHGADLAGQPQHVQFTPIMRTRLVRHPGYAGGLQLDEGQPQWETALADGSGLLPDSGRP
jgi:hypothetical protein